MAFITLFKFYIRAYKLLQKRTKYGTKINQYRNLTTLHSKTLYLNSNL